MYLRCSIKKIGDPKRPPILSTVGMTGFEPATTRPPDNYNYCTDNADYLLVTYLLLSSGLIVGLITA